MSIPSDIPPSSPPTPPQNQPQTSSVDPTGAWAKFLSTPNQAASAEDVKMFIGGLLKMFNVLIQQQQASAKRAAQFQKDVIEGRE